MGLGGGEFFFIFSQVVAVGALAFANFLQKKKKKRKPCHVCHVLLVFPFYPPSWVLLEWITLLCFCFLVIWKFVFYFWFHGFFTNFNEYFYLNINNSSSPSKTKPLYCFISSSPLSGSSAFIDGHISLVDILPLSLSLPMDSPPHSQRNLFKVINLLNWKPFNRFP